MNRSRLRLSAMLGTLLAVALLCTAFASTASAAVSITFNPVEITQAEQKMSVKVRGLVPRRRYSLRASNFSSTPAGCEFTIFPTPNPVRASRSGRITAELDPFENSSGISWCNGRYTFTVKKAHNLALVKSKRFRVSIPY